MGNGIDEAMISIDFFCGGGGITKGLINSGIEVLGGFDFCNDYRDTYEKNNWCKFISMDIRDVGKTHIYSEFPEIDGNEDNLLLAGCAPCQPFSSQRRAQNEHTDVNLLTEFGRIVEFIRPAHVLVENVPGLMGKGKAVFSAFLKTLEDCGYFYTYKIINAKDYGVPQNRNRLALIASRFFRSIIPEGTYGEDKLPYVTVRDAIAHYPPIKAGRIENLCKVIIYSKGSSGRVLPSFRRNAENRPLCWATQVDLLPQPQYWQIPLPDLRSDQQK